MQEQLTERLDLTERLKAFVWICDNFVIDDFIKDLKVSDVPYLVDHVETAILKAVQTFNGADEVVAGMNEVKEVMAKCLTNVPLSEYEREVATEAIQLLQRGLK